MIEVVLVVVVVVSMSMCWCDGGGFDNGGGCGDNSGNYDDISSKRSLKLE